MGYSNKEDSLRRILKVCLAIQASTERPHPHTDSAAATAPISLTFPPLPDLLAELRSIGLAEHSASTLNNAFHAKCTQLQAFFSDKLSELQSVSSSSVHAALRSYIENLYLDGITRFSSDFLALAQSRYDCLSASAKQFQHKKATALFNHDYVPVLENYFQYNAYPSSADRSLMARKSMMTERQIEVWFQNHRNRARKEGRVLARLRPNDPLPPDVSFTTLSEAMGDLIRPESDYQFLSGSEESGPESTDVFKTTNEASLPSTAHSPLKRECNPLDPQPSPHPTPSISFLDAVSRKSTLPAPFPLPMWPRRPSTTPRHIRPPPTTSEMDELVGLFSRLTVRQSSRKPGRRMMAPLPRISRSSIPPTPQTSSLHKDASNAATRAITTVLCSGRHPAFIAPIATSKYAKTLARSNPPNPSNKYTVLADTEQTSLMPPQSSAARHCSPVHVSSSHASSPSIPMPRRSKKSPHLPRRVPGSSPISHTSLYHPYSTSSRTSSTASLSSSSSDRSTSPSVLATPEHKSTPPPSLLPSPPLGAHSSDAAKSVLTSTNTPPPWTILPTGHPGPTKSFAELFACSTSDLDQLSGSPSSLAHIGCFPLTTHPSKCHFPPLLHLHN